MSKQDKPSFFAILPATVRYDKRLKPIERIIFAEITCLSNKHGYATASNSYFQKVFDISKTTASRYISRLVKFNYVRSVIERGENKQIISRRLYPLMDSYSNRINEQTNNTIEQIINTPIEQTSNTPIEQTSKENNTSILNNTRINNNESDLDNDFIDFRELIKRGNKIGNLGHAKAILQTELNLLTFSDHENKQLKDLLYKIKGDLKAYNKLNKIEDNVTDGQIIKAFQTSVKHFKETTDSTKYSISYLKSCINPNVFLVSENNNLNDYKQIVKETFKHYKTLNRSEVATLEKIKKQISSYLGTENDQAILNEFKKIFDNLPDYIMEKRSYQSIGYINSKLTELLLQTDYKNDAQYILLERTYGAKKAQSIYNKKYKITN